MSWLITPENGNTIIVADLTNIFFDVEASDDQSPDSLIFYFTETNTTEYQYSDLLTVEIDHDISSVWLSLTFGTHYLNGDQFIQFIGDAVISITATWMMWAISPGSSKKP